MLPGVAASATRLDKVFHALGDPTRRSVLSRLGSGPASTTALAKPFRMALPSFMQHLDVLQDSGLVRSEKVGRTRVYRLVPKPLAEAERWMASRRATWQARLDQLDDYLVQLQEKPR